MTAEVSDSQAISELNKITIQGRLPYGGAAVTGPVNLFCEVVLPQVILQPATCLLQLKSTSAEAHRRTATHHTHYSVQQNSR
jgi:hypothetical protein